MFAAALRAGYEPVSAFDRKPRIIYAIIAVEMALNFVLFSILGIRFSGITIPDKLASALCLLVSAWAARRAGFDRLATWLEASSLTVIAGFCGWALLYPATVWALPYGDWWLSAADQSLGFDFRSLYLATASWPLAPIYQSFAWQLPIVVLALVRAKRDPWTLVLALCVAMIITILVYPFGTTIGPIGYYHLGPPGNWTPMIEAFRDHNDRIITPDRLVGMVSFPSYHAAVGVLIICATWPLRVARWLFLPLNVGMLFTTIPYGEHYLVDVIGGVVVAIIALLAARRCYEKT